MTPKTQKVVAGNWKMHHGPSETRRFFEGLLDGIDAVGDAGGDTGDEAVDAAVADPIPRVAVFPPALSVHAAVDVVAELGESDRIELGVQNIHWEASGAFTGEVSAGMARAAGAGLVLVGHSERRHVFGETDEEVAKKVAAARVAGLVPVVCVGETLEERRAGEVSAVILRQLDAALAAFRDRSSSPNPDGSPALLMVAYEPVWAIGTGETATPKDASHAHEQVRGLLEERLGGSAHAVPILYGGSVKPHNAGELLDAPGVDGVLVGGASLDPESFLRIIDAARAR